MAQRSKLPSRSLATSPDLCVKGFLAENIWVENPILVPCHWQRRQRTTVQRSSAACALLCCVVKPTHTLHTMAQLTRKTPLRLRRAVGGVDRLAVADRREATETKLTEKLTSNTERNKFMGHLQHNIQTTERGTAERSSVDNIHTRHRPATGGHQVWTPAG